MNQVHRLLPFRPPRSYQLKAAPQKVLIVLVLLLFAAQGVAKPVDVSRQLEQGGAVRVDVNYGKLRIVGTETDRVRVRGEVDDSLSGVTLRRDGGALEVRVRFPLLTRVRSLWDDGQLFSVDLEIEVPRSTRLFVVSRDAGISIEGVEGPIGVGVVSSDVEIRGQPARLDVETVSGSLRFEGETPSLKASTMSGDLRARGSVEGASLEAVSGALEVRSRPLQRAQLSTVSGDVVLGRFAQGAQVEIETHSGDVLLECCSDRGIEADFVTRDSEIINEVNDAVPVRDERGRRVLQAAFGDAVARARVRTRSGLIRLVPQLEEWSEDDA